MLSPLQNRHHGETCTSAGRGASGDAMKTDGGSCCTRRSAAADLVHRSSICSRKSSAKDRSKAGPTARGSAGSLT